MKVYTHCAKIQQNPKSYIKRLNITYNTGLGQPHVGSWGRGRIIWRLCTQLVVGREGINVNSSESLHNTGPQCHLQIRDPNRKTLDANGELAPPGKMFSLHITFKYFKSPWQNC